MRTRCNGEEVYTIIKFSEKVKNFMGDEWELNGFLNGEDLDGKGEC